MSVDLYMFIMPGCCGIAPFFSSNAISLDCCVCVYVHIHTGETEREISPPPTLSNSLKAASAHNDMAIDRQMFQSWV